MLLEAAATATIPPPNEALPSWAQQQHPWAVAHCQAAAPCTTSSDPAVLALIPAHVRADVFAAYCAWLSDASSAGGKQFAELLQVGSAGSRHLAAQPQDPGRRTRVKKTTAWDALCTPPLQVCPELDVAIYRHAQGAAPQWAGGSFRQWYEVAQRAARDPATGEKLLQVLLAAVPCPARRRLHF